MTVRRPISGIVDCRLSIVDLAVGRALFETAFVCCGGEFLLQRSFGGEGVEAVLLGLDVAGATVGRGVDHAVAGHDAVNAPAAHPVVHVPVIRGRIDELDARPRRQEKLLRCLGRVAAVVEPVDVHVGRELIDDLARAGVAADEDARVLAVGDRAGPDEPADDEQVLRRLVPRRGMLADPETLARRRVIAAHRALAPREQHHVLVRDQSRTVARVHGHTQAHGERAPLLAALHLAQADDLLAVAEQHALGPHRHRHVRHGDLLLPEGLARLETHRLENPLFPVPRPAAVRPLRVVPDVGALLAVVVMLHHVGVDHQVQHAVGRDHLGRALAARERPQRLARGGVEFRHRRVEPERDVDAVAQADQATRHVGRAALEPPEVRVPHRDRTLPQDRAVERIAGDQRPLARQADRRRGAFVDDVEDAPAAGDQRRHAGHVVMVAAPARAAHPLHPSRRADDRILRHRVAAGVVPVVRPLVNLFGARLDRLGPLAALLHVRHAVGTEHAHHVRHRRSPEVLRHDQIDQVLRIRQPPAGPPIDRHLPVDAQRLDMLPRLRNVGGIPVQTVHHVRFARPQRRGQLPVPGADVNDQPTPDARGIQNLLGQRLRPVRRRCIRGDQASRQNDDPCACPPRTPAFTQFPHHGITPLSEQAIRHHSQRTAEKMYFTVVPGASARLSPTARPAKEPRQSFRLRSSGVSLVDSMSAIVLRTSSISLLRPFASRWLLSSFLSSRSFGSIGLAAPP